MKLLFSSVLFLITSTLMGQGVLGYWQNIDDKDGKPKSIIKISENEGLINGEVVELLEAATITHCQKCKGDQKGASLVGMPIMWDLKLKGEDHMAAHKGKILDPKKGKIYGCKIEIESDNVLKVRGYMKSPLFGRSQIWYRVEGPTHNKTEDISVK